MFWVLTLSLDWENRRDNSLKLSGHNLSSSSVVDLSAPERRMTKTQSTKGREQMLYLLSRAGPWPLMFQKHEEPPRVEQS